MNKIWKIGTNISAYILEISELQKKHGSRFELKHLSKKTVIFEFHDGFIVEKTKSTASQFMRVLLSLGFIESDISQRLLYKYDKSVLQEDSFYINSLNKEESIGDFISQVIVDKVKAIYEKEELLFPSEKKLIFSILAVHFSKNQKFKKYINMRLESSNIDDIVKYYVDISMWINESSLSGRVKEAAEAYVVGFTEDVSKVIESIDRKPAQKVEDIFAPINLKNQIISESHTFGSFVNEHFTSKTQILIPVYQRKYIWPESTVKILLNDIKKIRDKWSSHYLGNIIIKTQFDGSSRKQIARVIDGQQRITTLVIIARALFDFGKYKNMPVDRSINQKFSIIENSNDIASAFNRVEGNDDYDAFKLVVKGDAFSDKAKHFKSHILENYKSIINWLSTNISSKEEFSSMWDHLLNKIVIVLIDVKEFEEYQLFEKLNTGAVPLTTLELFKNYVLDVFHKEGQPDIVTQRLFDNHISTKFDGKNKDIEIEKFLITYLRIYNSSLSKEETIFNQFKSLIEERYIDNNPDYDLNKILGELGKEIDLYQEIRIYKKYINKDSFAFLYSDFLYMLDGRSVYFPLIIKLIKICIDDYENPTVSEINILRKYLRIIEIYEVRIQIATYRGQSLSAKIESILLKLQEETTPEEFWMMFKDGESGSTGMPTVDQLKDSLMNGPISNKPARMLLTRLENYFNLPNHWEVDREDTTFAAIYDKPSQREHLLPSKWQEHWKEYLQSQTGKVGIELEEYVTKYVDYIGNAFPIPAWSNNQVKNKGLKAKKKSFGHTSYSKFVKMFNGIDGKLDSIGNDFTPKDIINRTNQVATLATEIWCDYQDSNNK